MAKTEKKPQISDEVRRAKEKARAALRAQFSLQVSFDRIDYRHDVIDPAIKQLELDAVKGEIPQFTVEQGV